MVERVQDLNKNDLKHNYFLRSMRGRQRRRDDVDTKGSHDQQRRSIISYSLLQHREVNHFGRCEGQKEESQSSFQEGG